MPNQQCQGTEGNSKIFTTAKLYEILHHNLQSFTCKEIKIQSGIHTHKTAINQSLANTPVTVLRESVGYRLQKMSLSGSGVKCTINMYCKLRSLLTYRRNTYYYCFLLLWTNIIIVQWSQKNCKSTWQQKKQTNDSVTEDKNRSQDCQRSNERLKISVLSHRLKAISDGDVMTSDSLW